MRQYSTQDASLVVMCRFNVGKGMHGWYGKWIIQPQSVGNLLYCTSLSFVFQLSTS
jgi:hypothetical protein